MLLLLSRAPSHGATHLPFAPHALSGSHVSIKLSLQSTTACKSAVQCIPHDAFPSPPSGVIVPTSAFALLASSTPAAAASPSSKLLGFGEELHPNASEAAETTKAQATRAMRI